MLASIGLAPDATAADGLDALLHVAGSACAARDAIVSLGDGVMTSDMEKRLKEAEEHETKAVQEEERRRGRDRGEEEKQEKGTGKDDATQTNPKCCESQQQQELQSVPATATETVSAARGTADEKREKVSEKPTKTRCLVFMDWMMPIMDGETATRAIRALRGLHCQPFIVAVTACAFDEDRDGCLAAGADAYVRKPATIAVLRDTVRDLFENNGRNALSGDFAST